MITTVEQIRKHCIDAFRKDNLDFDHFNLPIAINGRLTQTLGRCFYTRKNGVLEPSKLEFSRQFLETSTDECIISVIYHECAHALTALRTGEPHGHDAVFKATCARIGCTNDGAKTTVERTVEKETLYKYIVICPKCGVLGGYNRMCKTLREISQCRCKDCHSKITYQQTR